jgi:two-component system, LuxR family, sensor kinase FixL
MPPLPPSPARLRGRGHPVGRSLKISSTSAGNDKLVISIEDASPGLDPSIAGRVFEPLFTIKENGMGLGLAICRSIVEAHGGRLSARPAYPCGTTFEFTLPLAVS